MNAKSSSTAIFTGMVIMLADGVMTVALAGGAVTNDLSASQILEKGREAYVSLVSYSDEGQIVTTGGGATTIFSIRLARPNFYKIEWERNNDSSDAAHLFRIQAVWSSGAFNSLDVGCGIQEQYDQTVALTEAVAPSSGVAATIPMTFFHTESTDALDDSGISANRQADEIAGGVDCYVITWKSQGQTKTIWIGQQDFLIRQIRTVVSTEAMREEAAKWDLEMASDIGGFTATEIHTNIVVNQQFSRTDFIPSFSTLPLYGSK